MAGLELPNAHLCVQTRELRHGGHSLHHHTEKEHEAPALRKLLLEEVTGYQLDGLSTVNKVRSPLPLEGNVEGRGRLQLRGPAPASEVLEHCGPGESGSSSVLLKPPFY